MKNLARLTFITGSPSNSYFRFPQRQLPVGMISSKCRECFLGVSVARILVEIRREDQRDLSPQQHQAGSQQRTSPGMSWPLP